jgi:hypothetical protein
VMNLGDSRRVDVVVTIKTLDGTPVTEKRYSGVTLPAGRTATDLPAFKPAVSRPAYYVIEYEVVENTR